jgi:hypothetical protein
MEDFNHLPSSCKEAISLGVDTYFTGKSCKYNHTTFRYTSNGNCSECMATYNIKYREEKYEELKIIRKEHWELNKENISAKEKEQRNIERSKRQELYEVPEQFIGVPRTRREAVRVGSDRYFTGKPCSHGHVDLRRTSDWNCLPCALIKKRNWDINNSDKLKKKTAEYRERNRDLVRERARDSMRKHKDRAISQMALRRAHKLKATPSWFDRKATLEFYKLSKKLMEESGVKHNVDHIVPLTSNYVCGLHWEGNLQILTAEENLRKKNYFWPDMPDINDPELKQLAKNFWSNPDNVKNFRYSE